MMDAYNKQLSTFTALGRGLEPSNPTNLAIMVITALSGLAGGVYRLAVGDSLLEAAIWAFFLAAGVFTSWVLTREIDPDHPYLALAATAFAGLFFVWLGPLDLLGIVLLISLTRLLSRSFGPPATWFDSLVVLALTALLGYLGQWGFSLTSALALWLDSQLPDPQRRHLWMAGLALLTPLLGVLAGARAPFSPLFDQRLNGFFAATAIGFFLYTISDRAILSTADLTGQPLDPNRLQAARLIALLAVVLVALLQGKQGVAGLGPLWAGILISVIGWLGRAVYRRFPRDSETS